MLLPNKKYDIIYADPPWSFKNYSKKDEDWHEFWVNERVDWWIAQGIDKKNIKKLHVNKHKELAEKQNKRGTFNYSKTYQRRRLSCCGKEHTI